jgi:hypothetical protein
VHRLEEPGDIEPPGEFRERSTARHHHQLAGPLCLEFPTFDQLRPAGNGILHHRLVIDDTAKDQESAVGALGDRRQRRRG